MSPPVCIGHAVGVFSRTNQAPSPECSAVWAFLNDCAQISSLSLVNDIWVRVNREEEGLWSNPPRPKQHQEGETSGEPQPGAAASSQPRFQPAWASRNVSLASSVFTASPSPPRALSSLKMMKFRFRRQGTDPQREKIKQELFAFNKVK